MVIQFGLGLVNSQKKPMHNNATLTLVSYFQLMQWLGEQYFQTMLLTLVSYFQLMQWLGEQYFRTMLPQW